MLVQNSSGINNLLVSGVGISPNPVLSANQKQFSLINSIKVNQAT